MSLRVAVLHNLPPGGAKRTLRDFVRDLVERGHAVDAYAPSTAEERSCPLAPFVGTLHTIPVAARLDRERVVLGGLAGALAGAPRLVRLFGSLWRAHWRAARLIDAGGYDLAFVHHDQFTQAPLALFWLRTRSAYFCQEPLRLPSESSPAARRLTAADALWRRSIGPLDRSLARRAGLILANSSYSAGVIRRRYGREPVPVHLGVDAIAFSPGYGPRSADEVLAVGALHPTKAHDFVVRAIAAMPRVGRPQLRIVANRVFRSIRLELENLAARLGVRLVIEQDLADEALVAVYRRSTLLVHASHFEPFGLEVLEAMACGTPVVAVAEGGVTELVDPGATGELVPRDEIALARRIAALLADPERRERYGRAARQAVLERWTSRAAGERLERALLGFLA